MEIKSRISSAIQPKVSTENTETKNPAVQAGVANIRDGFETNATANSTNTASPSKLNFVKQQMTNFMSSNSPGSSTDSIFSVMMEYQKIMNKEAREEKKLDRDSKNLELASKQSKFSSDAEIGSAKGSPDMYQVVNQEASTEFFIGQAGRISKGDHQKDIDTMKSALDELKKSATDIKEEILQKSPDKDNVNKRYEMLISWISSRKDDD